MFKFHSWPILHFLQLKLRRDAGQMALRGRGGSSQATYGKSVSAKGTAWYQTIVTFPPKPRGVHVITNELQGWNSPSNTLVWISFTCDSLEVLLVPNLE